MNPLHLLRLVEEPRQHLAEADVHKRLMEHASEAFDHLASFYHAWSDGQCTVTNPSKLLYETAGIKGDYRVMPCIIAGFAPEAIHIVKIIGTNEENQVVLDKICVGLAVKLHPFDYFVEYTFDVCALSSFRTALISVFASSLWDTDLSNRSLGVIGTGRIGFYTSYLLYSRFGVRTLRISDRSAKSVRNFMELARLYMPDLCVEVLLTEDLLSSVEGVYLATTSPEPVIKKPYENLCFISSVGADANNLSEVVFEAISDFTIVVDNQQSSHYADLARWKQNGKLKVEDLIELPTLLKTSAVLGKMIFISTGIAVQDALIIDFLTRILREDGTQPLR